MNEKDYKKYAEQGEGCNRLFDDEVAKVADQATKTASDWRLSEKGKEDKKKEAFAALNKTADMIATVAKKCISDFCKDFSIILPEDDKDHTKDIENALHIIDLLGFNLDVKNLENDTDTFGVGISSNITKATVRAFFSGLNRLSDMR